MRKMRNMFNDMISRLDFLYYILEDISFNYCAFTPLRRVWWVGGSLTGLEGSEETHSAGSMNKQIQFKNSSSIQCVLFKVSGGVSGDID
jgi:hypothetical protein